MGWRAVAVAVALAIGGCGDGGDSGGTPAGDPIDPGDAAGLCGDLASRGQTCGWSRDINDLDFNCGEAAVILRAEVFRDVAECGIALPCDGDATTCVQFLVDAEPLPIHDSYAATCETRTAECELVPDSDTSSIVLMCDGGNLATYATPIMEALIDCFGQGCADVVPCVDDVL